jgi:1-acyl-sn-glycerol-3-phosphate acyltransferase
MKILQKIKAISIFTQFVITVTIVIFFMTLFPKSHWKIRRIWAKMQKWLIGYELEIAGTPDPEADMLIINHQSLLDIILLEASYPRNIAWVAKKEIADIPFFGKIITLPNNISINREDKKSLLKLFADCKNRLEEGRVIAIFPEGTRGDGKKLAPFKAGTKLIASKLKLKVQPVIVVNSRNVLDSQNFLAKSGKVKLIYLDSFYVKDNKNWFEDVHKLMQDRLNLELQSLNNAT